MKLSNLLVLGVLAVTPAFAADLPLNAPFPLNCIASADGSYSCSTHTGTVDSDPTGEATEALVYAPPAGYSLIPRTAKGVELPGGREKFHVQVRNVSSRSLICQWWAKGSGLFKEGGRAIGYCTAQAARR